MSNGLSGMAYGLSAAIGAKLARPDAPVLAAVGDGGFSMNAQELETAERVGAPFITVVLEDGSYSLIKISQAGREARTVPHRFRPDRHGEDGGGVRRRRPAHEQPRRARRRRRSARSIAAAASSWACRSITRTIAGCFSRHPVVHASVEPGQRHPRGGQRRRPNQI